MPSVELRLTCALPRLRSRWKRSRAADPPVRRGDDVVAVFLAVIDDYGPPASTLTDNGSGYTCRFTGGRNTQGKTERFHETLQRWLRARPTASSTTQLQRQLDQFREYYNEQRPHRALHRRTPGDAYRATPKAAPATNGHAPGHHRQRYDRPA